jgi:hypothetical protein
MSKLFDYLKDTLMPQKSGKCCQCGELTQHTEIIADDVDEEGNATGCRDYCCERCYDRLND